MVTYVATVFARQGHEDDVARFYQSLEPLLQDAPGFRSRQLLRANPGTMLEAVQRLYSAEELARHAEPPTDLPQGVHFVIVESWDSVDARMSFSRGAAKGRSKDLFPHLHPEHTHEFYEDVTHG